VAQFFTILFLKQLSVAVTPIENKGNNPWHLVKTVFLSAVICQNCRLRVFAGKNVIFSDETQIVIGKGNKVYMWRKDEEIGYTVRSVLVHTRTRIQDAG
jgi:hypothetical protein